MAGASCAVPVRRGRGNTRQEGQPPHADPLAQRAGDRRTDVRPPGRRRAGRQRRHHADHRQHRHELGLRLVFELFDDDAIVELRQYRLVQHRLRQLRLVQLWIELQLRVERVERVELRLDPQLPEYGQRLRLPRRAAGRQQPSDAPGWVELRFLNGLLAPRRTRCAVRAVSPSGPHRRLPAAQPAAQERAYAVAPRASRARATSSPSASSTNSATSSSSGSSFRQAKRPKCTWSRYENTVTLTPIPSAIGPTG